MKVGSLVKARTKRFGGKFGLVVSVDDGSKRYPAVRIRPFDHPRDIWALLSDVEVVSETALCSPLESGGY
tara:strand:+ start:1306 stop:1515 length:210 start_codon:yes stop_codon:yes gene_type:complete